MILSENERYGNFPYEIIEEKTISATTLEKVKLQLRILDNSEDIFLKALINTATLFFESFSKQDLLTKTRKTYRTIWDIFLLRRCPLQSIESIKYYDEDGNLQIIDSGDYFIIKDNFFGKVGFDENFETPTLRNRSQQIEIEFKTGFGDSITNVPEDIQQGLIEHITHMFENRGDCVDNSCSNIALPNSLKMAYKKYKIQEVGV